MTSGPSSVWPKKAYRNPVDQLVTFLDKKHGEGWAIFEFRAEGTGYPDAEVYNRVHHFPWPDHHPPPFALVPNLMAAMRNWIHAEGKEEDGTRVAVVHCKAGKGRSGTVACSYLISQEAWKREDALKRFTSRRMRAGFGEGVSIPSQLRWVRYVDRWTNAMNKKYMERPVEVLEIQVYGLRTGVKVSIEGFIDEGKRIKNFHTFVREEKTNVDANFNQQPITDPPNKMQAEDLVSNENISNPSSKQELSNSDQQESQNVILKPSSPIRLETSDINVDFERRNNSSYTGFTMVTSIAHVWFNAWFEGGFEGNESGIFEIEWDAMDGIKGSERKGIKALDRLKVVWKYSETGRTQSIDEPRPGEPVKEGQPADWRGAGNPEKEIEAKHSEGLNSGRGGATALVLGEMSSEAANKLIGKDLGLRKSHHESANISRASSVRDASTADPETKPATVEKADNAPDEDENEEGIKSHVPDEDHQQATFVTHESHDHERQDTAIGKNLELGIAKLSNILAKMQSTDAKESEKK